MIQVRKYRLFAMITAVLLSGCASVALKKPLAQQYGSPVIISYCIKSSAKLNVFNKALSKKDNEAAFAEALELAKSDINHFMNLNSANLHSMRFHYQSVCAEKQEGGHGAGVSDAQLYFIIDISGYGSVKRKWKAWLIGTGVVEGVVQGVVVGSVTHNPWLGLGVSLEEIVSEYLTWNGVDWLLGESFAPVTLDGELVRISDQKLIWRDSFFTTKNKQELNKLQDEEKKSKPRKLQASLHKVEAELLRGLDAYLQKEIIGKQPVTPRRDKVPDESE